MTALEALKRLEQETAPNTYLDDFDKRACIDAIKKELKASNCLKHTLDNNTLYRAFTYEEAKSFENFLKSSDIVREWLEEGSK